MSIAKQVLVVLAISGCQALEDPPTTPLVQLQGHAVTLIEDRADGSTQSVWLNVAGQAPLRLVFTDTDTATDTPNPGDSIVVDGVLDSTASTLAVDKITPGTSIASPTPCSTTGVQNTAVFYAVAPGASQQVSTAQLDAWFFGADPSVDGYLQDASYGQTSATGVVLGPYTLDRAYTCNEFFQLRTKVVQLANPDIYLPDYNRLFFVYDPGAYPTQCSWNGTSLLGCSNWTDPVDGAYTVGDAWLNESALAAGGPSQGPNDGLTIAIHEMGHELGIQHAQSRSLNPEAVAAAGVTPLLDEYGDLYSVMGGDRVNGFGRFPHFAASHKNQLNWLSGQVTTVTGTGVHIVSPYEDLSGSGVRALKIQRPGTTEWLWLEFRQPIGAYDTTMPAGAFGHALIHFEDASTGLRSQLLDFTPQTNFEDATLHAGSNWTDPYSGLSITVLALGNDLQVAVVYGVATCTATAAGMTLTPASTTKLAGETINSTLTVSNNDTGMCPAEQAFDAVITRPTGWSLPTGVTSPFALSSGGSTMMAVSQAIPTTATVGDYVWTAKSNRGGTTTTRTTAIEILPTVTATVPGTQFNKNQTVIFTGQVKNGGVGVPNVSIIFRLVKLSDGSVTTVTKTTNSSGTATWSRKLTSTGTFELTTTSTVQGKTGTSPPQQFVVVP